MCLQAREDATNEEVELTAFNLKVDTQMLLCSLPCRSISLPICRGPTTNPAVLLCFLSRARSTVLRCSVSDGGGRTRVGAGEDSRSCDCLQEERESGYFDEDGHYVERKDKDEDATDAWLESTEGALASFAYPYLCVLFPWCPHPPFPVPAPSTPANMASAEVRRSHEARLKAMEEADKTVGAADKTAMVCLPPAQLLTLDVSTPPGGCAMPPLPLSPPPLPSLPLHLLPPLTGSIPAGRSVLSPQRTSPNRPLRL